MITNIEGIKLKDLNCELHLRKGCHMLIKQPHIFASL
jgi:hypothetical protein